MKATRILIVDDEAPIRKFVRANLEARGYEILMAVDGEESIKIIEKELPDLILLDIMMPKLDGFEVCRRVREWSTIPIIMLTARDTEIDKVRCLDCGADDYLTKPFSLKELFARIKAVLRRSQENTVIKTHSKFVYKMLEVDFASNTVKINKQIVNLTHVESKIIQYLCQNPGRIITSGQLIENVWGDEYVGDYGILQVNISRLRKKLNDEKVREYIQTKPGIGYMMTNDN